MKEIKTTVIHHDGTTRRLKMTPRLAHELSARSRWPVLITQKRGRRG